MGNLIMMNLLKCYFNIKLQDKTTHAKVKIFMHKIHIFQLQNISTKTSSNSKDQEWVKSEIIAFSTFSRC